MPIWLVVLGAVGVILGFGFLIVFVFWMNDVLSGWTDEE